MARILLTVMALVVGLTAGALAHSDRGTTTSTVVDSPSEEINVVAGVSLRHAQRGNCIESRAAGLRKC
jgi:hypothetical protein